MFQCHFSIEGQGSPVIVLWPLRCAHYDLDRNFSQTLSDWPGCSPVKLPNIVGNLETRVMTEVAFLAKPFLTTC